MFIFSFSYYDTKRKFRIALFKQLNLEEAVDLSQDRLLVLLGLMLAKCVHFFYTFVIDYYFASFWLFASLALFREDWSSTIVKV
jgi:hypothetical protein